MVLANRTRVQNSRTLLRAFGGLNEGYGCSEAEYSAGINFSSRDFPALSTRKPRRKLRTLTGLNGMYHLNGLLTVCGKDLVYTPDDGGETVTCTDAVADSKKALVGLGTKILIFPDKVAFDTADGSVSALGACWKAEGQSVEFAPCDAEGRTYTPTGVGREEPESPADGQIFLKVEDEEHPWRYDGTLEVYSAASGNWTALPLGYCRITAAGAQEKFCQWDTVTVQGTAAKQAGQWEALDGDCVVYAVTENSLCVRADPAGDYFYGTLVQGTDAAQWTSLDGSQTRSIAAEQTVQLERRVPDLDFVTECDNRVWGCSSRENVIYACKLGDPTNWFSYRGIAADSYAVTVGSDGAFTGAASAGKIGKIELANHGTLFLDEIGELPPHIQSKLLQLIQEKTIERVSGTKRIELDFRLLVATNRNLEEEVQRGLFRSDLFYRLNVIRVHIPPLRQRPEDILPMAHQFLERFCKEYGKQLALSPRFVAFLEQYPWPGNVRQLENLMERLVITAQNPILDITALPLEYNSGGSAPDLPSQEGTLAERMDAFEGQIIRDSYRRCGTTVAVAKELGISQATAVRKIAKYVKDRKE